MITRRGLIAAGLAPAARKPNIVFLYSDDQGAWTLGASGNKQTRTPHADRLCREGAYFENSFTTTPVCSPSRASLMTGRYALEVGIEDFLNPTADRDKGLDPKHPVWPRILREAGYRTGLVGKWHLGYQPRFHPSRFGFEYFAGFLGGGSGPMDPLLEVDGVAKQFRGSTPDIFTSHAVEFIRRHKAEPFVLCCHYREPHASNAAGGPARTWLPLPDADWARFRDLDPAIPNPDFDKLDVPEIKRMMREYLASVACLDRNVGRVLALLDELDLARDTIVVFTGDNGMNMGHNGIWHKGNGRFMLKGNRGDRPNLYDQSLRVPAVVRFPRRIRPGTRIQQTISNLDWFPSLLRLTGTPVPAGATIRGRDWTPLLTGRRTRWDNSLHAEYNMRHGTQADLRGWRTPEWKLVRDLRRPGHGEFYDLKRDPAEAANLIHSSDPAVRKTIEQFDARLHARMSELGTGSRA
ncbi:MAG: DUF4976 domain-containing protein [Acidobacteria bacterium]|nr:DUF4976 domain-containing protein [Acidobacteriota bacterium]